MRDSGRRVSSILFFSLFAALSLALASTRAAAATFTGIGDLTGGSAFSQVFALSGDGSTAVGRSESAAGYEAVRFSIGGGLLALGSLTTPNDFATASRPTAR